MDFGRIAVRALFAYIYLLALLRTSGKRSVGEGTPVDFVMALALGDLVDNAIWADVSIATFVSASGSIILFHIVLGALEHRFAGVARLLQGTPLLAVSNGTYIKSAARAERLSECEKAMLERERSVRDSREIKELRLETSGQPSVIAEEWAREAQKSDLPRVRKAAS